ncbi:MAG: PilZ domain-containing protein [Nitrospira sp.]|nr:PilZ domain-containing protein [Nitrospira sp.]
MSVPSTKRMYRRIPADYIGYCLTQYSFQAAIVRDISLNGFRIEGPTNIPRESVITLQLWLPDGDGVIDVEQVLVRWKKEREIGVQIVTLSNEADYRLARHVEERLRQSGIRYERVDGRMKRSR